MKKPPRDRLLILIFILYGITIGSASAYIAAKFVSPCICIYGKVDQVE